MSDLQKREHEVLVLDQPSLVLVQEKLLDDFWGRGKIHGFSSEETHTRDYVILTVAIACLEIKVLVLGKR